jgi:putative DNA primase/helicase
MTEIAETLLCFKGERLPQQFWDLNSFCLWKYETNKGERCSRGKIPFDWTGKWRGNNHPALHLELGKAIQKVHQIPDVGLALFQPETGIKVTVDGKEGFLFILDLDGFLCNEEITDIGWQIIEKTNSSYFEISPSGVGIKIYVVTDMEPFGKKKYRLPPNEFSNIYPEVKKYGDSHAVEVFTSNFWNVVTGNRYSLQASKLKFVSKEDMEELFDYCSRLTPQKTMVGNASANKNPPQTNGDTNYSKLTKPSLEKALSQIDNFDEELWGGGQAGGGVVNILARVYGEEGRDYFQRWSSGVITGTPYPQYSEDECNKRFDRALNELTSKPHGFGIKQLCKLAGVDPMTLDFEAEPVPAEFEALLNSLKYDQNNNKTSFNFPVMNKQNRPAQVTENLEALIAFKGIMIRYNQISKDPEILMPGLTCVLDEVENTSITLLADEAVKLGMSANRVPEMATAIASQKPYCPIQTYIESNSWDGVSRFDQFLSQIKTDNLTMASFLLRKWFIQAVGAIYEKNGLSGAGTIVFTGNQGAGKTRLFKDLTSGVSDYFLEGAILNPESKDSVLTVCSHWIVELGELDATFKKSEIAQLKAFLTRNMDTLRRPYARKDSNFPRRTVFAGTVNDLEFLRDSTGNRRFWPIEVSSIIRDPSINYQQLWAEVKTWFENGEGWHLDSAEIKMLNDYSERFTISDPIIEALHSKYDFLSCKELGAVSMKDICEKIGLEKPSTGETMKIATEIRKRNGGKPPKISNGRKYHYVPAKTSTTK